MGLTFLSQSSGGGSGSLPSESQSYLACGDV